jgi:hypothetical protein
MDDGSLRLKIHGQARLVGRIEKINNKQVRCIFYKRENHDDYKRK